MIIIIVDLRVCT